jgi:hypothetical protein
MEGKYPSESVKIFSIYRTLMEMMRDRGYEVRKEYFDFEMDKQD